MRFKLHRSTTAATVKHLTAVSSLSLSPDLGDGRWAVGDVDAWDDFEAFLLDLLLLSETEALIGKFTSNFDRAVRAPSPRGSVGRRHASARSWQAGRQAPWCDAWQVFELMAARSRCVRPYVSLDSAWCHGGRGFSPRNEAEGSGGKSFVCDAPALRG